MVGADVHGHFRNRYMMVSEYKRIFKSVGSTFSPFRYAAMGLVGVVKARIFIYQH
jgi:hypothetical protein